MSIGILNQTGPARKVARFSDYFPMYATQYLRSDGGRFVTLDTGTGAYKLSTAASSQIDGWVDDCYSADRTTNPMNATPLTTSSTNGGTICAGTKDVKDNPDSAFWIPCATGTTASAAAVGTVCDIAIEGSTTTTKQVANIGTNSAHHLKIVDFDSVNNLVLVVANV